MDAGWGNLRLFVGEQAIPEGECAPESASPARPISTAAQPADPSVIANQELIRPPGYRRAAPGLVPFSAAWFDELEQKRYQRHGLWLSAALEFGRHPGESLLLLGPGAGSDVVRYVRTGTQVTVGVTPTDYPEALRANLARSAQAARIVEIPAGHNLPFADGSFDVVAWNALHNPQALDPARIEELFRVLKSGGKVIGLFPARFDCGYWQDLVLPLQWLYWRRPIDPTSGKKTSSKRLRRAFGSFVKYSVGKRHLRRSELPHLWRALPLVFLERLLGRVLIFKAFKPLSARTGVSIPLAA